MEFSWNPNTKWEKPQCSISMHPFSQPPGENQQISKQCLRPLFFKISQGYILWYFFKLFKVLSLQNACWIFSDFCGENFLIYGAPIPRKCIEPMHAPVPHSKLKVQFFESLFCPRWKGWRKLFVKISWNIIYILHYL